MRSREFSERGCLGHNNDTIDTESSGVVAHCLSVVADARTYNACRNQQLLESDGVEHCMNRGAGLDPAHRPIASAAC